MSHWYEDNSHSIGNTPLTLTMPDSGERYLSSPLFEGIFDACGFAA